MSSGALSVTIHVGGTMDGNVPVASVPAADMPWLDIHRELARSKGFVHTD